MSCTKCKKEKPIVNKKYCLCYECNFERTHGETIYDYQKRKQIEYRDKQRAKQQKTPIKQQTAKEASIKSKLSQIKKEIRLEAVQNNEYYCKGCGTTNDVLNCSHILSVSMFKHLELVKENMQLLCQHKCHRIWESGHISEKMQLNCFESNLEVMKKYDVPAWQKMYNAWQEELNNYFTKNI